ncbi:hypothetical protein QYM36_018315 [Artemia franciscana]|uniref:Uncharacterized protein n=1 Tax=Artemia franciscana TaxID=6661 RepID=A0AA88H4L6_ARTSF|nr:hypothetical protein QYM36_018315 [Artemia franciscana]
MERADMINFMINLKMMLLEDEVLLENLHENKGKQESEFEKLAKSEEEKVSTAMKAITSSQSRNARVEIHDANCLQGFIVKHVCLPMIFHAIDGKFRKYEGPRGKWYFIAFIEEKKWKEIEPLPFYVDHCQALNLSELEEFLLEELRKVAKNLLMLYFLCTLVVFLLLYITWSLHLGRWIIMAGAIVLWTPYIRSMIDDIWHNLRDHF